MACCNDKRARWARPVPATPKPPALQTGMPAAPPARTVGFEYVGATALQVIGPITRAHYRFPAPGARAEVDRRDAAYMAGVPNLRRMRI
jgi:hypothetical protein